MNSRLKIAGVVTALGLLAIALVGRYEGYKPYAYRDPVGIWTACYGETKGIRPGMKFTKEECGTMFLGGLTRHEGGMRKCLKDPDALPDETYLSFLSLTYNIGTGGFCKSSVRKLANAGDLPAACHAILKWNKAGGRVLKGLVTRRASEKKLCLKGLAK